MSTIRISSRSLLHRDMITVTAAAHFLARPPYRYHTAVRLFTSPSSPPSSHLQQAYKRFFSHQPTLLSDKPPQAKHQQNGPPKGTTTNNSKSSTDNNPQLPSFDLSSLGLSKNMRIVVITLIGIFGTIETWVWTKAIWYWWKGGEKGAGAKDSETTVQ